MRKDSGKKEAVNLIRKGIACVLAALLLVCGMATPKVQAATKEPTLQKMAESGHLEGQVQPLEIWGNFKQWLEDTFQEEDVSEYWKEQFQILEMWRNFILDLPAGENDTRLTYRFWWGNLDEDDDREMIVSVGEINLNMGIMQEMLHVYDLKKEDGEFTPVKLFEELPPVQIRFGFSASKEGDMLYSYVSALATGTFSEGTVKLNEEKTALVYTETAQRSMAKEEKTSLDALSVEGNFDPTDKDNVEWGALGEEILVDHDFVLGEDNNGFSHSYNGELSGFTGIPHYKVTEEQYQKLTDGESSEIVKNIDEDLTSDIEEENRGVCFGLTALIGLVANGSIAVSELDSEAGCFYNVKKPNENPTLFHEICYLFFKQYLLDNEDYVYIHDFNPSKDTEEDITKKLQQLVESIHPEQWQMITYRYTGGGHSVLIKSMTHYPGLGIYDLTTYDQNSVGDKVPQGVFYHIYIQDDFSDLVITRGNGTSILRENLEDLSVVDVNTVLEENNSNVSEESSGESEESSRTILTVGLGPILFLRLSDFPGAIITNESGSWSSEGVEIERLPSIVSSTSDGMDRAYQRLVLPSSSSYTVTCDPQEEIDLSLATEDGYYSVQGKGIDSILLSQEEGIKINGDQFDFTAGYLVDNGEEDILTRTEGAGSGTVSISTVEGELSVSSENKMSLTDFTVTQNMQVTRYDLDKESSHMTWDVNGGAPKTGSSVLLWLILSVAFAAIAVVILSLGTFLLVRYFRKKN